LDSIQSILNHITYRIHRRSETPGLDAQVLLADVLGRSRAWVLAHPEAQPTAEQQRRLETAVQRLEAGEPLPYVLGRWEFYGLELEVGPAALIPRPETELLVEEALRWLIDRPDPALALDVGTGTGCIAVSLAVHAPQARILATDLSPAALRLAARNAARHAVSGRVWPVQSDLAPACSRRFDLICANLPYIPSGTLAGLKVAEWEPGLALDGGVDGLDAIRRLLAQGPALLSPGGMMLLEIEARQGPPVRALAEQFFPTANVNVLRDLAGEDRLARIQVQDR
jgi:release factor glutamine methyltransferase